MRRLQNDDELRKRKKEKILFCHHLAAEIADFAKSYMEVNEIITRVKREFEQSALKNKPVIREQPTDDWGIPIGVEKD